MNDQYKEQILEISQYVLGELTEESLALAVHDWYLDKRKFASDFNTDEAFKKSVLNTVEELIRNGIDN